MISSNLLENRPLLQIPHPREFLLYREKRKRIGKYLLFLFRFSEGYLCLYFIRTPHRHKTRHSLDSRGSMQSRDNAYVKRSPLAVGSFLFPLPPSSCFRSFSPLFLPSFPQNKRNLTCENTRRDPFRGSTSFKGSPRIRTISQKFKTKWICPLPFSREKFVSRRPIYTELSVSQIESLANCSPTAEQAIDSTSRSLPRSNRYFWIFVRVQKKFDFDD